MKKMKRVFAAILCVVTCFALSVPSLAADASDSDPDVIRLEIGQTYTFGDITITFREDTRTPEERAADMAESGALTRGWVGDKYYFFKDEEYQSMNPWNQHFDCEGEIGDTLHFDIDNYASGVDINFRLEAEDEFGPVEAVIEAGVATYAEVHTNNDWGLDYGVDMSITSTGGLMWFALSACQYWQ